MTEDIFRQFSRRNFEEDLYEIVAHSHKKGIGTVEFRLSATFHVSEITFQQVVLDERNVSVIIFNLLRMQNALSSDIDMTIKRLEALQAKYESNRKSENLCEGSSQTSEEKV